MLLRGWQNAIIESDCKFVMDLCSSDLDPRDIGAIAFDIRAIINLIYISFSSAAKFLQEQIVFDGPLFFFIKSTRVSTFSIFRYIFFYKAVH